MLDELVFQPQMQHGFDNTCSLQGLTDCAAGTAHDGTLFQRDQRVVGSGYLEQQLHIQRLGPAHVDHGGTRRPDFFSRLQRGVKQRAKSQNCNACTLPAHFALAKRQACQSRLCGHACARAAWVAHGHRVVLLKRGTEQLAALVFVGRAGNAHVGNAAQIRNVVGTRVGGTIGTDQASAVQGKHHGQVLQCHIMNQLVIAALQKRRINRHHGLEALTRHTCGECHRMLLGNTHIVVALGKAFVKLHHARAFAHRRGDAD